MSERDAFGLSPVPLMSVMQARDLARSYKALANHLADNGVFVEARQAERQSAWWMAYAVAVSQIPPGASG